MVSQEAEPAKPERVAAHVIEDPEVAEVAVQTVGRLVLALITS
jgi:hypothetical protein